jgi:hypothetical protein
MNVKFLRNFGYIENRLPTDLFNSIKKECFDILEGNPNGNFKRNTELSGEGVPDHYNMKINNDALFRVVADMVGHAEKTIKYSGAIKNFTRPCPLWFDIPWINYKKKGEFIPNHIHDGLYSYNIWVNIPYDIEDELKTGDYASTFEFTFNSITGHLITDRLKIDKTWEGKIMLFPALLQHCVYPFYTSDGVRISVAGNVQYKT